MLNKKFLLVILAFIILLLLITFFFPTSSQLFKPKTNQTKEKNISKSEIEKVSGNITQTVEENKKGNKTTSSTTTPGTSGGEPSNYTVKVNYTLSIESLPPGLKVFTSYYLDGEKINVTLEAPYSVQADEDSLACTVAAYLSGSGVVKWEVDGENCEFSECEGYQSGCNILMDKPHTVTLHYTPIGG